MAKIAVETRRPAARLLAVGEGWTVSDIVCTAGPHDRPFEERHQSAAIAIVVAGTFQCRSGSQSELLTPGSLFLGNTGQGFECSHQHGTGDRCVSFSYAPEYFDRLAFDAGAKSRDGVFPVLRVPPLRDLSKLLTRASAALDADGIGLWHTGSWQEFGVELAARTIELTRQLAPANVAATPSAIARVTNILRHIERYPSHPHALTDMARQARLSEYHFLRVFQSVAGLTPHQYVVRTRLREAARRLLNQDGKVLDIALDCGFGDISNFNRAFRSEFGVSPRVYRTAPI